MNKADARNVVVNTALEYGIDPKDALSIWQQESGQSTNLDMRGITIPSGPHAGHYARGPWQIMTFHGEIPQDFEGQTRWAMNHLKERGIRGYYGTGKAPPGFPTTEEYDAQVLGRAGKSGSLRGSAGEPPAGQAGRRGTTEETAEVDNDLLNRIKQREEDDRWWEERKAEEETKRLAEEEAKRLAEEEAAAVEASQPGLVNQPRRIGPQQPQGGWRPFWQQPLQRTLGGRPNYLLSLLSQ